MRGLALAKPLRVRMPRPERISLVQPRENVAEWWITLDGQCMIGFAGDTAREQAAKRFLELTSRPRDAQKPAGKA